MAELAIGVDVGGTKIAAGVVDRQGRILRRIERPTEKESQEKLLALLDEIVEGLMVDGVVAIGFGLPSTIDQRSGRVVGSVHIPIGDLDFRDRMAETLLPCRSRWTTTRTPLRSPSGRSEPAAGLAT